MDQLVVAGLSPLTALFLLKYRKALLFNSMVEDPELVSIVAEYLDIPDLIHLGLLNTHCQ